MGMVGADVDQLRALARTLEQAADRLESTSTSTTGMLNNAPWKGPDADRYRSDWRGSSLPTIRNAAAALREAATALTRNADDQERTSSAGGAASGGGDGFSGSGGGGGGGGGWSGGSGGSGTGNPFVDARDFLRSDAVWPISWGTAADLAGVGDIPALIDAIGLAGDGRLTDEQRITQGVNSLTDAVGGAIKKGGTPISYGIGVAVAQWGDVFALAREADFSASGIKTVTDYIAKDPGGAAKAALDGVIGYVPKLASNLKFW